MIKNLKKNLIPIIIAAGVLVFGVYIYMDQRAGNVLSPQAAAKKAIDFINQTIEEDVTASLLDVAQESGVYKVHLKIADTEYDSYITKDGKLLFSSAFNLTKQLEKQLENFAKCLADKGAKFYGAFWCSWCDQEKKLFGEAAQYLPYIECSDQKTREMLPFCQEAGVTNFPTWEFNGEKAPGFKTLEELAELSGCTY